MSWFQPGSLEPLHKYELLGLLVSLAIYNGLTLPFTFPLALYRKLLGLPITTLQDIEDGWPELAKGLEILRDWPHDDVEEVFSRPFVFSVDVFGTVLDVDMDRVHKARGSRTDHHASQNSNRSNPAATVTSEPSPNRTSEEKDKQEIMAEKRTNSTTSAPKKARSIRSSSSSSASSDPNFYFRKYNLSTQQTRRESSPSSEPIMVNNNNRHSYIHAYIEHLTNHSITAQYAAFEAGFFSVITHLSISLFTAEQLKHLIEGLPDIDVPALETITKYEGGFHAQNSTIRHFWTVVKSWKQERVRKLLEFVTASDRLPTGGMERVTFVVQRNGSGDGERLPTSLTCFGRLLLPEYEEEGMLRVGLETAVENSKGFGQP